MKTLTIESIKAFFEKVGQLPYEGKDFAGISINENEVYIKSETYYNGCGTEFYTDIYSLEDVLTKSEEQLTKEYHELARIEAQRKIELAEKIKSNRKKAEYEQAKRIIEAYKQ